MIRKIFCCLVLLCLSYTGFAQKTIQGKTDRTEYMIGDEIHYSFSVDKSQKDMVLSTGYVFSDTLNLISQSVDSSKEKYVYNFVLSSFVDASVTLPSYTLYKENSQEPIYSVVAPTVRIKVPEIDTVNIEVKELKSIAKVPVTLKEILPIAIVIVVLAALVVAGFYLARYLKKRRKAGQSEQNKIVLEPEDIEAVKAIVNLKEQHYIERNEVKLHYIVLGEIVWRYINRRFDINAFEMTSGQIVEALSKTEVRTEDIEKMRYVFEVSDFVKFAKHLPTIQENLETMKNCLEFIDNTKKSVTSEDVQTKKEEVK